MQMADISDGFDELTPEDRRLGDDVVSSALATAEMHRSGQVVALGMGRDQIKVRLPHQVGDREDLTLYVLHMMEKRGQREVNFAYDDAQKPYKITHLVLPRESRA